jgi:magnesium-protoporphyrin IX monomethyl ester (oxidative) cyclase
VVIGEGEKALVDILDHLSEENHSKIPEIDGVACYHNGKIVVNEKTNFIEDLDSLKFPSVNMLDISNYFTDTTGWHNPKGVEIKTPVPILSSRSCPKQCNFCSMHFVHGKTIRYRSPENVVTEMKYYINEFGLRYFNITDDNLTINKKKLIRLMDMIVRENLDIQFSTENGVFIRTLDEEAVDAMSDAGLVRLHMAFETGSDYIRNIIIGKGLLNKKIEELRQIFTKEKYFHIYLYGYFVIGFPEETEETLEETYQLIQSFPLDNLSLFYAIPFPGTSLYSQCERDGLFIGNHYYDPKSLVNMGSVGQMVKGDPNVQPYNLEISKLVAFREKVMKYLADTRTEADVPPSSPLRYDPSKPISYTQRIPIAMSA